MTVLIVSSFPDPHARAVIAGLAKCGASAELLDLADFPGKLTLTLGFGDGKRRFQLRRPGAGSLDMESVRAVWWRRPGQFGLPGTVRDQAHRRLAI